MESTPQDPGQEVVAARTSVAYQKSSTKHIRGNSWYGDLLEDDKGSVISNLVIDSGTDVDWVIRQFLKASISDDVMAMVHSCFAQNFRAFGFGTADVFRCLGGELLHIMRTGERDSAGSITYCLGCDNIWKSATPEAVTSCVSCETLPLDEMFDSIAFT